MQAAFSRVLPRTTLGWVARGGSRNGNRKGAVDGMRRANQAVSESCAETDAENMPQKAACTFIVD